MSHWVRTVNVWVYANRGVPEGQAADYVKGNANLLGDQPIVAAPAYIGIVVSLAIIACFRWRTKNKVRISFRAITAYTFLWCVISPALTGISLSIMFQCIISFWAVSFDTSNFRVIVFPFWQLWDYSRFKLDKEMQMESAFMFRAVV
jgi:ABC-type Fe3+-siderophore transport system permease subunit